MKKLFLFLGVFLGLVAAPAKEEAADCSHLLPQLQQFASLLSPGNREAFCGQFTQAMRQEAMQMAVQKKADGTPLLTPDQAVEVVIKQNSKEPLRQQTVPKGCPIK